MSQTPQLPVLYSNAFPLTLLLIYEAVSQRLESPNQVPLTHDQDVVLLYKFDLPYADEKDPFGDNQG